MNLTKTGSTWLVLLLLLFPLFPALAGKPFTQNDGQLIDTDSKPRTDIRFYTGTKSSSVFLRKTGFSYV
ncbi:MAG: hypothetical protein LPK19_03435, partial [Hymenobacteraceae bacterium]|nr:hypothetical protein [Hymenobacteraceae bacterium]MDX5395244.1 hypothetical protein [Hymenobacteraceae bacterium]MDX5511282.1 hypothetical protein [Hymenobacteraceae bacterium]